MALNDALEQVKKNLEKHGFPQQIVSFASSQLASYCHKQDISLTSLLESLKDQGINYTYVEDRIQFSQISVSGSNGPRNPFQIMQDIAGDLDLGKLQETFGKNPDKKPSFMDIMKALGPSKIKELGKKIAALSPEERQSVMDMAKSMGFNGPFGK